MPAVTGGRRALACAVTVAARWSLILPLVASSFQCSRSLYGYVYRAADTLLLSRVDSYLNLNAEQEALTRQKLKRLHTWHRRTELPAYATLFQQIAEKSRDGLDEKEVDWIFSQTRRFERRIYEGTRRDTVEVLLTLTAGQIDHLDLQLKKSNNDLAREVGLPASRRQEKRLEKAIENAEDWVGDLSAEQKRRVALLVADMPDTAHLRLRYRKERQREFVALLRKKPTAAELDTWLKTRFGYEPAALPDYYRGPVARSARAYRKFVLELDRILTSEQRRTAKERLLGLAADFQSWSR